MAFHISSSRVCGVAVMLAIAAQTSSAADDVVPKNLPDAKREVLARFLSARKQPDQFLPSKFTFVTGADAHAMTWDLDAKGPSKEYLSAIVPFRDAAKADVYFFRPNPKKGVPGITVKVTVDLETGKEDDPKVLVLYSAPLTKEELAEAVKVARATVPAAAALYAAGAPEVAVSALLETVTAVGFADRKPGDRVVYLQLRKNGAKGGVAVPVNLTQQTVLKLAD